MTVHRSIRAVIQFGLFAVLLLPAVASDAGGTIPLVQVSRDDEVAMQAQSPIWAPPDTSAPMLTYEVNDRSRRIYLRMARRSGDSWAVEDIPLVAAGTPGSFVMSENWVDHAVSWVSEEGFFFTRTMESEPHLYYFDVAPHKVPWAIGAVEDPAVSPDRSKMVMSVNADGGTDMYVSGIRDWDDARKITSSPTVVEHGFDWCPDNDMVVFAATDRDRTDLSTITMAKNAQPTALMSSEDEILAPSCSPHETVRLFAVYVRGADDSHDLLVVDPAGRIRKRVKGVHVEPGRPSPPAWTPGGRYIVLVREDTNKGNPIQALDVATGKVKDVPVDSTGNLEVSVGQWPDGDGSRTLLAVVAVGHGEGENVRNHLFVADITDAVVE